MTTTPAPRSSPDREERHGESGFHALALEVRALFEAGFAAPLDDAHFEELALRVFEYQHQHNPVYGAYCEKRGKLPDQVTTWTEIPAVPTSAFKHLRLRSDSPRAPAAVFRTSGTTRGSGERGVHEVVDLSLYHGASITSFDAHLLPEGLPMDTWSLVPSPADQPDSSLSHMVGRIVERAAAVADGAYFVDVVDGLDVDRFRSAAGSQIARGAPVLLLGTAFAFVHLADALLGDGGPVSLPRGSRIMETGGFKGRSRELGRFDLYGLIERSLGVDEAWVVNEYGMTELLSQFYDGVAGKAETVRNRDPTGGRRHRPPPWVRTRVLDPVTLAPVPQGDTGILAHFDLANLGTVCALLTEDLGIAHADGFEVLGRTRDSEPRGCSIAMDDLLAATGAGP